MALSESVVQILEEQARAQGFTRVTRVWLELGALSEVEPEAMQFCLEAVARGTLAQGAAVEIVRTPGRAWCLGCRHTVDVSARCDPCPACGSYQLRVTGGDEIRVKRLEVE